jgi:hypothetical protein
MRHTPYPNVLPLKPPAPPKIEAPACPCSKLRTSRTKCFGWTYTVTNVLGRGDYKASVAGAGAGLPTQKLIVAANTTVFRPCRRSICADDRLALRAKFYAAGLRYNRNH